MRQHIPLPILNLPMQQPLRAFISFFARFGADSG